MFAVSVFTSVTSADVTLGEIILPIGISFFTFQQIAFLVDVYRRETFEHDPVNYVLFVSFFPQLIAGPIVHHREMMPQFAQKRRGPRAAELSTGFTIFIIGLAKKVILADNLALAASPVFAAAADGQGPDILSAWAGVLAYSMQIYFDFSGYSDMAIGLGLMFGLKLPWNFASPYRATSIIDFWRCWHITLSRFLRDYLYIPLGGGRVVPVRRYANVFVTMLLGGIWHGAGWTFVLWGAVHGALIIVNQAWRFHWSGSALPKVVAWCMTFFAVTMAWVLFRSADIATAMRIYTGLFNASSFPGPIGIGEIHQFVYEVVRQLVGLGFTAGVNPVSVGIALPLALAIAICAPNTQAIMVQVSSGMHTAGYPNPVVNGAIAVLRHLRWEPSLRWALVLGAVAAISILKLNDVSEFIYFQF